MNDIRELKRLPSPAPKPQSLAWDGNRLWMGSKSTKRIYALDPAKWTVTWETAAPGLPYGIAVVGGGELRVICGETEEDNRIIRRCLPGKGFDPSFALPCPDDTGSQLGYDGGKLQVSQWYPKKVLTLGPSGKVERIISANHGICGQVWVDGTLFLMTTDHEDTNDYWLTRVDPRSSPPKMDDLARVPFGARALTFDGTNFWTNHREQNEIVCFAPPGGL
jgi:outer membrane protein assembly factor BamB